MCVCVCVYVCVGATSLGPFYYIVIIVCESFPPIGFSATADQHHPPDHPRHHLDEFAQHNYTRLEIQRIEITITNKQNEKKNDKGLRVVILFSPPPRSRPLTTTTCKRMDFYELYTSHAD